MMGNNALVIAAFLRWLPLLVTRCSGTTNLMQDYNVLRSGSKKSCGHGHFNGSSGSCECYEGWATAGITDTINFVDGVCDQYRCHSDSQCQAHLGIRHATCPVQGWNCYCGWHWAFSNYGHGWETPEERGGGACMGIMYTFSAWATSWTELILINAWIRILFLALICLPFGRKRASCDHHKPSLWKGLRDVCGCPSRCHGQCLMNNEYSFTMLKDDIAWSLYILDLGLWMYVFLAVIWMLTLFVWSVLLWMFVALICATIAVAGVCASCSEAASPDCCGCDAAAECGLTQSCSHSCCALAPDTAGGLDAFYWSGPFPDGYTAFGCCGCDSSDGLGPGETTGCSNVWLCCWPLAWLCYVFPVPPENAWGGLCGYLFGTHSFTPPNRLYRGGNPMVEFFRMGWRRQGDLHADDAWRTQVYNFLSGDADALMMPEKEAEGLVPLMDADGSIHNVVAVGQWAHAICMERPFELTRDRCVESSFADYEENFCWICQDSATEFDLWLSCHHIFCSKCSSAMLRRGMPCPLCRIGSSVVLRGLPSGTRLPSLLQSGSLPSQSRSEKSRHSHAMPVQMNLPRL